MYRVGFKLRLLLVKGCPAQSSTPSLGLAVEGFSAEGLGFTVDVAKTQKIEKQIMKAWDLSTMGHCWRNLGSKAYMWLCAITVANERPE